VSTPRSRRSLTHVGGATLLRGQPTFAALLAHALDVESSIAEPEVAPSASDAEPGPTPAEQAARAHVHGFHTYPARMHPTTAARLIAGLSRRGDTVLDPFCGSGTVLVEARRAGRCALGVDLNPLAVRLARRKATPASPAHREALVARARAVAEVATSRRKARVGASRRYPPEDVAAFDPHVLLELDGLRCGIEEVDDAAIRSDLELVLSSLLVKLSRRASDTSAAPRTTRIAAGFPTRSFVRKTEELVARLAEVEPELRRAPDASVFEGDARMLAGVGLSTVDLVVTSPPYAGVYDYVEHHRMRLRWLDLSTKNFELHEIGAKRHAGDRGPEAARERYLRETTSALRAVARVLRPGGKAAWLVADGTAADHPLPADQLVDEAAALAGLHVVSVASQERPHFDRATRAAFARRPRYEHAILLEKPRVSSTGAADDEHDHHETTRRRADAQARSDDGPTGDRDMHPPRDGRARGPRDRNARRGGPRGPRGV
jgi:DNA modification methylase